MIWSSGNFYSWAWMLDLGQPWIRPTSSFTSEPQIPHKSLKVNLSFQQTWYLKPPQGFYPSRTQTQEAEFRFKFISLSRTTNIFISLTSHLLPYLPHFSVAQKISIFFFFKPGNFANKSKETLLFGFLLTLSESINSRDLTIQSKEREHKDETS